MRAIRVGTEALATAVAAFRPETRRENRAAQQLAYRIQEIGEPFPAGFVPVAAVEAAEHYRGNLSRPPELGPVPSLSGIPMTRERAAEIYRARLKNPRRRLPLVSAEVGP